VGQLAVLTKQFAKFDVLGGGGIQRIRIFDRISKLLVGGYHYEGFSSGYEMRV
jgi:hypothetical protein